MVFYKAIALTLALIVGWLFLPSVSLADELEAMIGSLLITGFDGKNLEEPKVQSRLEQAKAGKIGGLLILKRNIATPEALAQMNAAFQKASPHGLLIAIDMEGGLVQRLGPKEGFAKLPRAYWLAQNHSPSDVGTLFKEMACKLRALGINYNFAPVVDLHQKDSPAIGNLGRAFSKSPKVVSHYAIAIIEAHRACNVATALKHFPGHGSAVADSHKGLTDISKSWQPYELLPYTRLIQAGFVDTIMSAHVTHKAFDPEHPLSLSKAALQDLLRQKMNFTGVVVSDDLMMKAIAHLYSPEEAAILALEAGTDILLFSSADPDLPKRVISAITKAVKTGRLTRTRLREAAERVKALKTALSPDSTKYKR